MKLIGKGLMLSVLFVLLLIGVKAELDPVFYDANLLNNYPYGNHHYLYESGDAGTASRGNQKIGSMWNEDVNAYAWDVNTVVAFCRGGGNDCPTVSGAYEAWVEFYGFVPATTNFKIYYFLDDFMRWYIDSTEHYYPLVNNYAYDTKELSPGWHNFRIYYADTGGGADHLFFQTTDGSTGNAPVVPYYTFFTALVSPDQYSNINQKIHLNEGSIAGDCSDFIDNDGDWNSDGTLSNDGAAAFNFNTVIYGLPPPQGRNYTIYNDDYPNFGEVNVDCFDQGCEGQDGPYDFNGIQGKCNFETEKIQYCNDGYDNDFDGFTDIDDTDCLAHCQDGDLDMTVIAILGSNFNPAANDGSDGCCGDDPTICSPSTATYHPAPCIYTTQLLCEQAAQCKWESNSCILKTHAEYCAQFSQSDCSNNNLCQFQSGDYGYVTTPNNDYLCYNNKTNFNGGTEDKWMWIYAPEKQFIITPLNYSGKIVDYISNSEEWYYCDANPTPGLTGLRIDEYESFSSPSGGDYSLESMSCSFIASFLTDFQYTYVSCSELTGLGRCCTDDVSINIYSDDINDCQCRGETDEDVMPFCAVDELNNLNICESTPGSGEVITEYCSENPFNCVNYYNLEFSMPCNQQPNGIGQVCDADELCANGLDVTFPDRTMCCIDGVDEAECVDRTEITDEDSCTDVEGNYYEKNENIYCYPTEKFIDLGTHGCCLGTLKYKNEFPLSSFEDYNNNTFSCFTYQGNNYIGQCCYDRCQNMISVSGNPQAIYVDAVKNRIFALKSGYNVHNSYDRYDSGEDFKILRDISKISEYTGLNNNGAPQNITLAEVNLYKKAVSMAYYDNIEFDILVGEIQSLKDIYINDVSYGPLIDYFAAGAGEGVPGHIIIPLREISKMQSLISIKIEMQFPLNVTVLYDNIYFSINEEKSDASLNNYCTGGFASWIDDLDPQITETSHEFFTGEDAWLEGYGRYAETCRLNLPYGWTGHYCCGDDTKKDVNGVFKGEFYEDTSNPTWAASGGCFNGTKIPEGESVWNKKGYSEISSYFHEYNDPLRNYLYADLLYINNVFLGCQVPEGKYIELKESFYGEILSDSNVLVDDSVNDQCAVRSKYYCINGVWRSYIPGIGQEYSENLKLFYPSIPSTLELKSVPPATNLIKNGDFGGPCPASVCDRNLIIYYDQ